MDPTLEDPRGYAITYDDEGKLVVTRLSDDEEIGRFPDRAAAVAAARQDRPVD